MAGCVGLLACLTAGVLAASSLAMLAPSARALLGWHGKSILSLSVRSRIPGRCAAADTGAVDVVAVATALEAVQSRVRAAASGRPVQLVAVSKLKSAEAVNAAYRAGQIVFGENYVQELLEKAPLVPHEVKWHFIGKLQSNKVRKLVSCVPNLAAIETVDSAALADRLAAASSDLGRGLSGSPALDVYVQVDTSGEVTKGGVHPDGAPALAEHIAKKCAPSLRLAGLMTIGAPGDPEAFSILAAARDAVATQLGVHVDELGLSMGMSGDFEEAIQRGATSVRVGSSIFGTRPPKPSAL